MGEAMSLRVTLIQGGGSGFDQVPAVKEVLAAAGVAVEWDEHLAGWAVMENGGDPLPAPLLESIGHEIVPGVVESIKVVTRAASERFLRFAFDYAIRAGRKSIACVHKANILKKADGLFLDAFQRIAAEYKQLAASDLIVDNACM